MSFKIAEDESFIDFYNKRARIGIETSNIVYANGRPNWDTMIRLAYHLIKTSTVHESDVVIELGCGTGFLSNLIPFYIGIDIAEEQIKLARMTTTNETAYFEVSNALDTSLNSCLADVIISSSVTDYLKEDQFDLLLYEMYRLCRKSTRNMRSRILISLISDLQFKDAAIDEAADDAKDFVRRLSFFDRDEVYDAASNLGNVTIMDSPSFLRSGHRFDLLIEVDK